MDYCLRKGGHRNDNTEEMSAEWANNSRDGKKDLAKCEKCSWLYQTSDSDFSIENDGQCIACLLYTSDAADDWLVV